MPKRKQKPTPTDVSCTDLLPRLDKLERAFQSLVGMTLEQYTESEADNPVTEVREFDSSVIRTHKDGKLEFLKKCPYCLTPVGDLATHKARCPKRTEF